MPTFLTHPPVGILPLEGIESQKRRIVMVKKVMLPLTDATLKDLKAGDNILLTGVIYVARDAAHKIMVEALDQGKPLPFDIRGQTIYYMGPSPAKPGQPIGSAGPTTSGRMDAYSPRLLAEGLKGMIGKGMRSPAVKDAMKNKRGNTFYRRSTGKNRLIWH